MKGDKPANKWKNGGVTITKWDNKGNPWYVIERTYKDKATDQWVKTNSYYPVQLKALKGLIDECVAQEKL